MEPRRRPVMREADSPQLSLRSNHITLELVAVQTLSVHALGRAMTRLARVGVHVRSPASRAW